MLYKSGRKMKKVPIFSIIVLLLTSNLQAIAHSPTDLELSYDIKNGVLHIEMTHVTNDIREDGIRRLLIYKNDEEVSAMTIVKQTTPHSLIKDVSFAAVVGDTIRVRAISKRGGYADQSIIISEEN